MRGFELNRKHKPQKYPHLRAALEQQYGLVLTARQLEKLATDPREKRDLKIDSTDTATREVFGTLVVWDVLGKGRNWPVNGDGFEYADGFYLEFFPAAKRKGYKVLDAIMADLFTRRDARIKRLQAQMVEATKEINRLLMEEF
jgi:hypothetical protein